MVWSQGWVALQKPAKSQIKSTVLNTGRTGLHRQLGFDVDTEWRIAALIDRDPAAAWKMVDEWRQEGVSDSRLYLTLALASARYVDHRGPLVGHGTLNAAPLLKAGRLLPSPLARLALLHMTCYVLDLIRHPNYGPHVMLELRPLGPDGQDDAFRGLQAAVESGEEAHLAEHLLVGALRRFGGLALRWPLTELALRQFAENEHRLLIVHRAADLMDLAQAWHAAEPLWRPAVQYLASHPEVALAERILAQHGDVPASGRPGPAVAQDVVALVDALLAADYAEEPAVVATALEGGVTDATVREALLLAASTMMLRSGFDAHAVTGIHAVSEVIHNDAAPIDVARLVRLIGFSSQRTRRQKAIRDRWSPDPPAVQPGLSLAAAPVAQAIREDASGLRLASLVRGWIEAGATAEAMTVVLMAAALTTAGPFDALHNVKMLEGLYQATRITPPDVAWRHLAAGARAVARSAHESGEEWAVVADIVARTDPAWLRELQETWAR
jgi:hypothetical protein